MISIIIPVYNQASKLIQTLGSLEAQTYKDFEIIIINDGSKDNVEELVGQYLRQNAPANSCLFLSQANAGAPAARNAGLDRARGDFLFFCDADAVLKPQALEVLLENLQLHPEASYAYSSFLWGRKVFKLGSFDAEKLKRMPYIHTMSLIRKSDFNGIRWDERIKKLQDWDLWLTMLEQGKTGIFVPQILFAVTPGGTISSWLPAFAYKLLPFLPSVKKYNKALVTVKNKHGLN